MKVDVIESVRRNRFLNNVWRGMRRKADVSCSPPFFQFVGGFETAALAKGPVKKFPVVDPVDGEQIDVVQPKIFHGSIKGIVEFLLRRKGGHLGLNHHLFAGQFG